MKKKLNTIIITSGFPPAEGGIETYMYNLASRWDFGKAVVLCNEVENKRNRIQTSFEVIRTPIVISSYFKSLFNIFKIFLYRKGNLLITFKYFVLLIMNRSFTKMLFPKLGVFIRYLNTHKEDWIIQCSTAIGPGSIGIFGKILFDCKFIVYIHGAELVRNQTRLNFNLFQKFVLKKADLIISNSHYTKSLAVNLGISSQKIQVVNLGADIDKFYPLESRNKIYKKYNIPPENKLLLSISHLIPRKGNDMVIKALPRILQEIQNLTYMISGEGRYKNELLALTDMIGVKSNIIFTGYIPDNELNEYLNACDVFVMPNRQEGFDLEGFGIVFLEANACKKPVIAGNSGGAIDAVIDGKTGYLVNSNSIEDISDKILKILSDDDKRRELSENGYLRVVNELNWKNVIQNIENKIINLYD